MLEHERLPFVSYPYEWSFEMLRDAALLQLDLVLAGLDEGIGLKDASAYNLQWKGASPVFVDVASFYKRAEGEPWVGYRQFCQMFLYPLLLQAYRDVPFQPWMRGNIDGMDAEVCLNLLSARDYLRGGVLAHVYLQAKAQKAYNATTRDVRKDLSKAGFDKRIIKANAERLRALVAGLQWKPKQSTWSDYLKCGHYEASDAAQKRDFVREVARRARLGPGVGHRLQRRRVFTDCRPSARSTSSPWMPTTWRSTSSIRRSNPSAWRTSFRSSST